MFPNRETEQQKRETNVVSDQMTSEYKAWRRNQPAAVLNILSKFLIWWNFTCVCTIHLNIYYLGVCVFEVCVFEVCVFEVCGLWSVFSRSVFSRHPTAITSKKPNVWEDQRKPNSIWNSQRGTVALNEMMRWLICLAFMRQLTTSNPSFT